MFKGKLTNLKGVKALNKSEQKNIDGGKMQSGFACYCNGTYVGEMSSIADCWNAC